MSAYGHMAPRPNWGQIGAFLVIATVPGWLLALALYLTGGLATPAISVVLQAYMLTPAFSAILLGLFVFRSSPLHLSRNTSPARWFFFAYLAYVALYYVLAVLALIDATLPTVGFLGSIGLGATIVVLVLALLLRRVSGRQAYASVGLAFGHPRYWLLMGAGFVLLYAAQWGLNIYLELGRYPNLAPLVASSGLSEDVLLVVLGIQTVLIGPILGLVIAFGEEFGWRGYLQSALLPLGAVKAVLVLGVIWGLWHAPIIVMGYNYPGHPVLGTLAMVGYTVALSFLLGYAVLKSGSVWLAAFLHGVNNQTLSFLALMVYEPNDPLYSFGVGIYGLAVLGLVVLVILRSPVWRTADQREAPLSPVEVSARP